MLHVRGLFYLAISLYHDSTMKPYDHLKIEPKWQKKWEKEKSYAAVDPSPRASSKPDEEKKKFYSLIEFPYPSGDGLHVGHIRSNTAMDIISRKRRREGYNVLYPIGWDAFGLPTENYAIKTGIQPAVVTKKNTDNFRRQLKALGFSFDWSREVNTTDPKYYKWTQWIFLQFFKAGLAYKKKMTINWCPKDLIGLANEEVVDGKCERCGTPVEKREKEQWMLAITQYADKLLEGLDATDYVMPKLVDKTNPHQPGKPIVRRTVAHAIVYDPHAKKFLIIRNKKFNWDTVIIGGIEESETAEQTARREVREETGYTDLEFKRILGGSTEAHYYTKHKGENRIAIATAVYFELKSSIRVSISDDEDKDNEILWVSEQDFVPGKMVNSELPLWLERLHNPAAGWPKPLLDWPESIKDSQRNWIGKSAGAEIDFDLVIPKKNKTRFVLIHGFEGSVNANFFPWLKTELEKRGNEVETPELPNSQHPKESEQVDFVLANCTFDENTVIVAHSLGAVVTMKALAKLGKPISGFVIVAAAVDPKFDTHYDSRPFSKDFSWDFDYAHIKSLTGGKIAILSDTNEKFRATYLRYLAEKLSARLAEVAAEDEHFCADKEPAILQAVTPLVKVFTTRPDTIFGVTYVVLAPEHPWVQIILSQLQNKKEVEEYIARTKKETDMERTDATREKTGVELKGIAAVNPANGEKVPVWIADYVLADYGTGAVMAVPAHDERDFDFAKKYGLPIQQVIAPYQENTTDLMPKKDKPIVRRPIVHAIIQHPKENKYLFITWKKEAWNSLVTGGIEEGEDIVAAGRREILEETGYKNVRHIPVPGNNREVHSFFYASHKNENRYMIARGAVFQLENEERTDMSEEEKSKHDLVWIDEDKARNFLTHINQKWIWDYCIKDHAYTGEGILVNSGTFSDKKSTAVMKEITAFVGGQWITKYKLRDWVFSRQRYWGEPIPMVHCPECGIVPVPEKDLPVKLPPVKNYQPTQTGESPLATISKWVNVKCPKCKGSAKRETDTMPNWAGSSWYYLRYTDPKNTKKFADMKKLDYWTPVDWYNGGMEHVTLHLLYSRFWHKFLYDQKLVPTTEPYIKRTAHGLILAKGGEKMSKSKGNVVNPDGIIASVGADSLRLYEMFMGPFDQAIAWDENGIVGCRRFLERVWRLAEKIQQNATANVITNTAIEALIHKTIKKVSEDIEVMHFNTAVSSLMIAINELEKETAVSAEHYAILLQLLAPFAPHITEELWEATSPVKKLSSIHATPWPAYDLSKIADAMVTLAVQINGKTRSTFDVSATEALEMTEADAQKKALKLDGIEKWVYGKDIKKVIYVKGRLINIVVA
jgi:leucyl-tRNA synthetase